MPRVMCVRGEVVHEPAREQVLCAALDAPAELSGQRPCRDRGEAAPPDEALDDRDVALERCNALGVCDQDLETLLLELLRHPLDERRRPRERRLEQHVVTAAEPAGAPGIL